MWDFVLSMLRGTAPWPTVVSLAIAAAIHFLPLRVVSGGVAVAGGFFAGWVSQDWGRLQPERYLDWSPYAALLLAAAGCASLATSRLWIRWCLWLTATTIAAWLLVPDFPRLSPPWAASVCLVAALGGLTASVLGTYEDRLPPRASNLACLMTGAAAALILAQSYGLKFSQMAGMLTAGLGGPFVLASTGGKRHVSIVFLPLLTAILFMGYANSSSDVPVFCYFLPVTATLPLLLQIERPKALASLKATDPETTAAVSSSGSSVEAGNTGPDDAAEATRAKVIRASTPRRIVSWALVLAILALATVPAILAHPPWEAELG